MSLCIMNANGLSLYDK